MREQTGQQYRSRAVPGKMQNCSEWGTYEPAVSDKEYKYLCHGGFYMGWDGIAPASVGVAKPIKIVPNTKKINTKGGNKA